ncbi:VOC family protein [Aggregatilinea lenta]|uniref:VOC family protein n=1 Tax=Aggregatilinea lenta TaxID=913108 RepID=UPI000E5B28D2|nr:VOC family protein [Aggregatilinea lenta]
MNAIIAELTVEDVDYACYWYADLGFEVELKGIEDDDGLQWASLAHSGRSVWLLRRDVSPYKDAEGDPRVSLYLQVEDVDALYAQIDGRGVSMEHPPKNQWYGVREFALRDPDGYRWVINQPIPPEETPAPPKQRGTIPPVL